MDPAIDQLVRAIKNGAVPHNLENLVLDFKQEKSSFKETAADLAEACVCFANASGGTLLVGIRNRPGGPDALIGTQISADDLRSKIYELTQPSLTVVATEHTFDGIRLLEITVPEGLEVYSTTQGEYRQRWKDECRAMTPAQVARLSEERRGDDWSAGASDSSVEDIHPAAAERVRELLRATGDESKTRLAQAPMNDILGRLGLLCDSGKLTRAGQLLLVDQGRTGPHELLVYQHRKAKGGEADFSRRWGGPLVTCFAEALETISARTTITPVTLRNGQQIRIEDFPSTAVREALANALIHRDLVDHQPVLVEHSPSFLTIRSPGPLVAGVTPENILTRGTKPRYPLLARAFNALGWSEYLGQGVNRMFREMARSGRPLPIITSEPERVEVVFSGERPNAHIARVTAELPEALSDDTDTLIVLVTLCSRRSVTAAQIAPLIQRTIQSAEETLRTACQPEFELLEPTAGTRNRRHPHYRFRGELLARLGSAVTYHSRTSSEVDKKIIEHVREYDSINNATIQRLFDIDVYSARDILQDLVGREILTRTSTQTRGKAVRYGVGPKFPEKKPTRRGSPQSEQLQFPSV